MSRADKDAQALAHAEFWDERYTKSDGSGPTHEWFRSYSDLEPFLESHLFKTYPPARNPRILHLGAGDSVRTNSKLREKKEPEKKKKKKKRKNQGGKLTEIGLCNRLCPKIYSTTDTRTKYVWISPQFSSSLWMPRA